MITLSLFTNQRIDLDEVDQFNFQYGSINLRNSHKEKP